MLLGLKSVWLAFILTQTAYIFGLNGEYINVQDSVIEVVYPKTFFKKTTKQIQAR